VASVRNGRARATVIPALRLTAQGHERSRMRKAGIQPVRSAFPKVFEVDSRLRGNDRRCERDRIPNDASARNKIRQKKRPAHFGPALEIKQSRS